MNMSIIPCPLLTAGKLKDKQDVLSHFVKSHIKSTYLWFKVSLKAHLNVRDGSYKLNLLGEASVAYRLHIIFSVYFSTKIFVIQYSVKNELKMTTNLTKNR